MSSVWPTTLSFKRGERRLDIVFEGGEAFSIPFELLRVESPSAEVQGHHASQKQLVAGKSNVGVMEAEPVGRYAVRLTFDDGHNSGIFSWDYLYALGENAEAMMADYAARLEQAGMTR